MYTSFIFRSRCSPEGSFLAAVQLRPLDASGASGEKVVLKAVCIVLFSTVGGRKLKTD
jgi:hypothetical protein